MLTSQNPTSPGFLGRLTERFLPQCLATLSLLIATTALSSAQVIQALSPESDGEPASAGDISLQIIYDVDVVPGAGIVEVIDFDTFDTVATFDITNPADATVSGNTVTFAPFTAVEDVTYQVEAPAGFVITVVGSNPALGFGFDPGDELWLFDTVGLDTTPPAIIATSPPNGAGASISSTLTITYDENITLAAGPWTIEVYDVTADEVLQSFTEDDAEDITIFGAQLSFTLDQELAHSNEYRVTASAELVEDSAGNLSEEITSGDWLFTTGTAFFPGEVVISQVYGGGGNSGAFYTHDFVELHNRTDAPISLDGWSVQYAAAAGKAWNVTTLSGTIQPGGYYLIQQAKGNSGSEALPTPDAVGTAAMAASNGKVALFNNSTKFDDVSPIGDPNLSDFVGFGSANAYEGSGPTAPISNTTAAIRRVAGSQDTDDNAADFEVGAPEPRNTSSPAYSPSADGSGFAIASNNSTNANGLTGTIVFPADTADQTIKLDLTGTYQEEAVTDIEIDIPADFGAPAAANITLSGDAVNSGTTSTSGQTIIISDVALTPSADLSIQISGLTTPDIAADQNDDGSRTLEVRTASTGGTPTALTTSPKVKIAIPVADLAALRAIGAGNSQAYILGSEVVVTYVEGPAPFRNQHWVQDSTGGVLIDDQPNALGRAFAQGDGISNLVGSLTDFNGLLQFNPILEVDNPSSMDNDPAPIELSLADLNAAPLTYQSRLVKVSGVSFSNPSGLFENNSQHLITQGADEFGFASLYGASYVGLNIPSSSGDIVGIIRRLDDNPAADYITPRTLADLDFEGLDEPAGPGYQAFADELAGGQGPLEDYDNDGVSNGLEYLFGVTAPGFTHNPQVVDGEITWPIDPDRTDVGFIVETSTDLVNWTAVPTSELDLTNPNAVTYVLPEDEDGLFVRIGAVFEN